MSFPASVTPDDGNLSASNGDRIEAVHVHPGSGLSATGQALFNGNYAPMAYDDDRAKSFEEKLASPDLEDQMSMVYPLLYAPPAPEDFDPGRIRVTGFFEKMYGSSAAEVRRKLAKVSWLPRMGGGEVEMTTAGGVDRRLDAVSHDIQRLGRRTARTVRKVARTFVWRPG